MVEDDSQESRWRQQELHPEGVVVTVVRCLEFEIHQIYRSSSATNEENLHNSVVDANEVGNQVEISRYKDYQKQSLAFSRDSSAGSSFPYF